MIARYYRFESETEYNNLPENEGVIATIKNINPVKSWVEGEMPERYIGFFVNTIESSVDPVYPENEMFPVTPLSRFSGF